VANESTAVNIGDDGDLEFFQVLVSNLLRPPVGTDGGKLAHSQPFNVGVGSFIVFRVGSVIADLRIGQDDDLAGVGGISENFLVAGEGGIKNDFAVTFAFCAVTSAAEDSSIFQRKDCLHCISRGADFINFIRRFASQEAHWLWISRQKSWFPRIFLLCAKSAANQRLRHLTRFAPLTTGSPVSADGL